MMPWKRNTSIQQKSYFKTEVVRELDIGGVSRNEINRRKAENDDLRRRIDFLKRKVDLLEDEKSGQGSKRISTKWDNDVHLKEIRILKERASRANKKVLTSIGKLKLAIEDSELQIRGLENHIESLDKEISDIWSNTNAQEALIIRAKQDLQIAIQDEQKEAIQSSEIELLDLRTKRRDMHAEATYKENEKAQCNKKIRFHEDIICKNEERILNKQNKIDKNLEIYSQMEAVRKKAIAEEVFSRNESTFQKEIEKLVKYDRALKKTDIEYIGKKIGKHASPAEVLKVSDMILNIFEKEISELFKANFGAQELIVKSLMVVAENIQLRKQANLFSKIISGPTNDRIEKQVTAQYKIKVPAVMWRHIKEKEKMIKEIITEAGFGDKKYGLDDPFTKRIYEYDKKQKETKKVEEKVKS